MPKAETAAAARRDTDNEAESKVVDCTLPGQYNRKGKGILKQIFILLEMCLYLG